MTSEAHAHTPELRGCTSQVLRDLGLPTLGGRGDSSIMPPGVVDPGHDLVTSCHLTWLQQSRVQEVEEVNDVFTFQTLGRSLFHPDSPWG